MRAISSAMAMIFGLSAAPGVSDMPLIARIVSSQSGASAHHVTSRRSDQLSQPSQDRNASTSSAVMKMRIHGSTS